MIINFSTRDKARSFAAKRNASGIPTKVTDNGKDAPKRYVVNLKPA
jgi:hypothetical protein